MYNLNLIRWLWWRLCMNHHGTTTSMRATSRFLYHTRYINSDLRRHFLIDGYGIFLFLYCTISYSRNMFAYDLLLYVYSNFFSTLDYVFSSSVYMLDLIPSLFETKLPTFPTHGPSHDMNSCKAIPDQAKSTKANYLSYFWIWGHFKYKISKNRSADGNDLNTESCIFSIKGSKNQ